MTFIGVENSLANDTPITCLNCPTAYISIDEEALGAVRYKSESYPDTASIIFSTKLEDEVSSYDLIYGSGALAFWDRPEEDLYSFEDGEAL